MKNEKIITNPFRKNGSLKSNYRYDFGWRIFATTGRTVRAIKEDGTHWTRLDCPVPSKLIRMLNKWTQAEFATRMGVSIDTVKSWESGRRNMPKTARMLAEVLLK